MPSSTFIPTQNPATGKAAISSKNYSNKFADLLSAHSTENSKLLLYTLQRNNRIIVNWIEEIIMMMVYWDDVDGNSVDLFSLSILKIFYGFYRTESV